MTDTTHTDDHDTETTDPLEQPTIACSDTVLTTSELHLASDEIRSQLFDWLHQHGLNENAIRTRTPITRDPESRTVTWHGTHRIGRQVHVTAAPDDVPADVVWPAPFPDLLLAQPNPGECPACRRAHDAPASADAVARGVADVLTQHQLGFSGRCVDERGMACADHWTPNQRRGAGQVQQHREHLAEVLATAGLLAEGGAGRG